MSRLIIIADDLTGAADTAACFAQAGLRTVVVLPETGFFLEIPVSSGATYTETGFSRLSSQTPVSIDVLSLSTDSRQLTAAEAARRVRHALDWLQQNGFVDPHTLFYKKVELAAARPSGRRAGRHAGCPGPRPGPDRPGLPGPGPPDPQRPAGDRLRLPQPGKSTWAKSSAGPTQGHLLCIGCRWSIV